ncbi:MAG TPA: N,N-dimethylformamidase beta subunit family domain-containing protein [Dongiaceae bacterium]|nr:N,N-dimethylformamidase beta subunit family domain-containing protein [Dongiaceae bacterium]
MSKIAKRILGYTDKVSVAPGGKIDFKVSSPLPGSYSARIVRLICGDDTKDGPGLKTEPVVTPIEGSYPARWQPMRHGSYAVIEDSAAFVQPGITLEAMIWPTLPGNGEMQAILGNFDADTQRGYALYIDGEGHLSFRVDDVAPVRLSTPLLSRHWYHVAVSCDLASGHVILRQDRQIDYPRQPRVAMTEAKFALGQHAGKGGKFMIAAWIDDNVATAHYNGKIDSPRVLTGALDATALTALKPGVAPKAPAIAVWDFAQDITGTKIVDVSGHGRHGHTVNLPTRAMKGWNWDASEMNWQAKPAHYGAIHFHDDDLYDCGWETDFTLQVPADLKSGIYCAELRQQGPAGEIDDMIPFYVRPPRGKATAPLALLIPTASYLAYSNHQMATSWTFDELSTNKFTTLSAGDRYLEENFSFGLSTYDSHTDGSGVCYSSRLRPVINMRPRAELWQFNADTHITDWLEQKGIAYDVITDDDMEAEGAELLNRYRCVMTGTHPEYYTAKMMQSVRDFTHQGGRLIYLGANGFYWRIAYHPTLPGVMEHRRAEDGMRGWIAEDGEYYMSFTGEYSGLWRRNGQPPQGLVGTGFSAQGFDISSWYERTPDSFDPRAAFIFEGVGKDEKIGDFGLIGGGAAGWEIDRADAQLGTPPHTLVVAVASEFPASYHWVKEEFNHTHSAVNGENCPMVRCDMTFFETPKGGAVFSTSSISWAGSFAHNGYDNNVSRITENVIKRFIDPAPL